MTRSARVDGLQMLGRRELSEAQVRERLARRGHDEAAIDDAIESLKESGAIDDARTAGALVRREAAGRRGPARARAKLREAGIASDLAERAIEEVYGQIDVDDAIAAALDSRLRGRTLVDGKAEMARLYRHLVGRGFDGERVLRVLRARVKEGASG